MPLIDSITPATVEGTGGTLNLRNPAQGVLEKDFFGGGAGGAGGGGGLFNPFGFFLEAIAVICHPICLDV